MFAYVTSPTNFTVKAKLWVFDEEVDGLASRAELYLLCLSQTLPQTCRYVYAAIKSFPPSFHARYILGHLPTRCYVPGSKDRQPYVAGRLVTRALRYPICNMLVLQAMLKIISHSFIADARMPPHISVAFELPKRLFRSLEKSGTPLDADSEPLPLLRFLCKEGTDLVCLRPEPNSHDGYPLVHAVRARFIPLVRFLLNHGADPGRRDCMAVKVAIVKKDLMLMKMLIEFEPMSDLETKESRRPDRLSVTPSMLELAVKCGARDIVRYLVEEKRCIPNIRTLEAIRLQD